MPNLAFATQLVPLRKISEAAKTMDENIMAISDARLDYNMIWGGCEIAQPVQFRKGGTKCYKERMACRL